jgi:hypothetical protein
MFLILADIINIIDNETSTHNDDAGHEDAWIPGYLDTWILLVFKAV